MSPELLGCLTCRRRRRESLERIEAVVVALADDTIALEFQKDGEARGHRAARRERPNRNEKGRAPAHFQRDGLVLGDGVDHLIALARKLQSLLGGDGGAGSG